MKAPTFGGGNSRLTQRLKIRQRHSLLPRWTEAPYCGRPSAGISDNESSCAGDRRCGPLIAHSAVLPPNATTTLLRKALAWCRLPPWTTWRRTWHNQEVIAEAQELVSSVPKPLQRTFAACYAMLVDQCGCDAYVKTIYVGFTLGDEMVAAIYPRRDHLEVAMALDENVEGDEFKDATHLTWPTMPVALEIHDVKDTDLALRHLREALRRIATNEHHVRRANEHFRGRRGPV